MLMKTLSEEEEKQLLCLKISRSQLDSIALQDSLRSSRKKFIIYVLIKIIFTFKLFLRADVDRKVYDE